MFSALTPGSTVYLLDKSSELTYKVGEVIGVSQPRFGFNNQSTVDLKVKVEDSVQDFPALLSISTVGSYNNGKIIISETKQGIQNEVEGILQNSKSVLDNIPTYESNVKNCEKILKQINPQFARDKERDDRLQSLENRFEGVESKLDEIFNFIKK